ncbi:hypothetical protein JCM19231_2063 [Vibrio ishigakensis]|uniref:Outer membrane protein beta-barrel domain-containing protein n=1 Tax=Vibrio ishigakensis TaxID=1481914 RepID=A0A0B8P0Q7_9VIBR|nr:porin family protein [Vibrio ishigakensis]GAM59796.1 hypothetical protein JCM19231_2063 [Vibrio ishigakensis]
MKKLILASTLALMSASSFAADDHSGFRVGGGFGTDIGKYQLRSVDDSGKKVEADPSVVLEAGYDFNDIFAINVKGSGTGFKAYENNKSTKGQNKGTAYDLAVEAEVGYTFVTAGDAAIKPYVALGAVGFDKKTSENQLEDKNAVRARGAAGVRMTLDNGVYFDGRIQATDLTPKGDKFNGKDHLLTQGLVTVGYKF